MDVLISLITNGGINYEEITFRMKVNLDKLNGGKNISLKPGNDMPPKLSNNKSLKFFLKRYNYSQDYYHNFPFKNSEFMIAGFPVEQIQPDIADKKLGFSQVLY